MEQITQYLDFINRFLTALFLVVGVIAAVFVSIDSYIRSRNEYNQYKKIKDKIVTEGDAAKSIGEHMMEASKWFPSHNSLVCLQAYAECLCNEQLYPYRWQLALSYDTIYNKLGEKEETYGICYTKSQEDSRA
jgi:hypothetical protein